MFMESLLLLQYLKTNFNSSFMTNSRCCKLSLVKNIFVSLAKLRNDSLLEQFGKSLGNLRSTTTS